METPSSTRRITRSQAKAALTNSTTKPSRKMEDSEKSKPRPKDRSALIDITNDSPIVGVASGQLASPLSSVAKQRINRCPGSGEALLRGQVKNLLQKVEEEAEISKFCLQNCGPLYGNLKAFLNSPAGMLAPTPVNTPQVLNFNVIDEVESFGSVSSSPIEDLLTVSKVVNSGIFDGKKETDSGSEFEKDQISRTLFLDFSEKSDSSSDCSSVLTYQGTAAVDRDSSRKSASAEDDDASIWSIQVNASTRDEEEEEEEEVTQDDGAYDEDEDEDGDDYGEEGEEEEEDESDLLLLDELCEGMSNIDVNGERGARFEGKHTRFVYNSDDELVDGEEVLRLKGLPTPKGKHLRFQEEADEEA